MLCLVLQEKPKLIRAHGLTTVFSVRMNNLLLIIYPLSQYKEPDRSAELAYCYMQPTLFVYIP